MRELNGTGVPLEKTLWGFVALSAESNPNRVVSTGGFVSAGHSFQAGPAEPRWGWRTSIHGTVRPHPSLETRLELFLDRTEFAPRFIEDLGDNRFILSPLQSDTLSLTLRQQWVVTPRLTLQAYAQLFTAYGAYGTYYPGHVRRGTHPHPLRQPGAGGASRTRTTSTTWG